MLKITRLASNPFLSLLLMKEALPLWVVNLVNSTDALSSKVKWEVRRRKKGDFIKPFPLGQPFAFSPTVLPNDPASFAFFHEEHGGHFGMKF